MQDFVVTITPHSGCASINEVKVTDWDICNNRRVIVHGVKDLFDPEFQTLLYAWYDSNNETRTRWHELEGFDQCGHFSFFRERLNNGVQVSGHVGSCNNWNVSFLSYASFGISFNTVNMFRF